MNLEKYIQRIRYKGELSIDINCLRELHKCHVMSVPFEGLDISMKKKISLDLASLFEKVVLRERGGFCYELNFLFYSLLKKVGFDCLMVSAKIFENEVAGPEFDHMAIVVKLDESYLVDVGYGDLFVEPLKIYYDSLQGGHLKDYKVEQSVDGKFILLESLKNRQDFKKRYIFDLQERSIQDFSHQCDIKQTSPDSYFVKNIICTIPTAKGRKTVLNNFFKARKYGSLTKSRIKNNDDLEKILKDEFRIRTRIPATLFR